MAGRDHLSSTVPILMISALLSGTLFALGHHLFYASLKGRSAPTGDYLIAGANVSKQQFNLAVGTSFAFLVKALLAFAVGSAYFQVFWRSAKTSGKTASLSALDTTFSILNNVMGFFKVHIWWRNPLLLLLAIVAWYSRLFSSSIGSSFWLRPACRTIPIASIVTPATLSVVTDLVDPAPSKEVGVPSLDFVNLNFLAPMSQGENQNPNTSSYCFSGPNQKLERIAASVLARGEVLSIQSPAPNASWTLEFNAPSLQCDDVVDTQRLRILNNIFEFMNDAKRCNHSYGYLSWMESALAATPFVKQGRKFVFSPGDLETGTTPVFYVATIPQFFKTLSLPSETLPGACMLHTKFGTVSNVSETVDGLGSPLMYFNDTTLLRCEIRNSSFTAKFGYVNGNQAVKVSRSREQDRSFVAQRCVSALQIPDETILGSETANVALNRTKDPACSTLNADGRQCFFDPTVVKNLSYQAMIAAFIEWVSGTIGFSTEMLSLQVNSSITKTVLMDTPELGFVSTWNSSDYESVRISPTLQQLVQEAAGSWFKGLSSVNQVGARGKLGPTLEQLFQNLTLSILSEPYFRPNIDSPYAPSSLANVTFQTYHNVYAYTPATLWIAYGLAILFATIVVAIGLVAMLLSGASFTDNFSTVLRVSRAAKLTEEMKDGDGSGREPLPKHLKHARLIFAEDVGH